VEHHISELDMTAELLAKYMPLEADLIGDEMVRALLEGAKPELPEHGESFDLTTVFVSLAATTSIINNIISALVNLRSKHRNPSKDEIKQATRGIDMSSIPEAERERLIQDVLERLESRSEVAQTLDTPGKDDKVSDEA